MGLTGTSVIAYGAMQMAIIRVYAYGYYCYSPRSG